MDTAYGMGGNVEELSLKVLVAYERDIGRGIIRIDHNSMDSLGVSTGDVIEVIGKEDGTDAKCYPLLPSDEGQGITRVDPHIRNAIGIKIDDLVTIRRVPSVPAENFARNEEQTDDALQSASAEVPPSEEMRETSTMIVFSGSCTNFDKDRPKIMEFVSMLESGARSKSKCKCYTDGKKAMGWDFFQLAIDVEFADKLREIYPAIEKQEAGTTEDRLAMWLNEQLKKMNMDFHLKLSEVPYEKPTGFRLDPEHYRDEGDFEDLR